MSLATPEGTAGASRVASGPLCLHAVANTPAGLKRLIAHPPCSFGFPATHDVSAPASNVSRPAQRLPPYGLQTCQVAYATLYTDGSDGSVASIAASIATGWSNPVPGWDLHPLLTSAFSRRT